MPGPDDFGTVSGFRSSADVFFAYPGYTRLDVFTLGSTCLLVCLLAWMDALGRIPLDALGQKVVTLVSTSLPACQL